MKLARLGELGMLKALGLDGSERPDLPRDKGWVGPGDDAAVIPPVAGPLVFASDLMAQGAHFLIDLIPPEKLGYKVLAVNVSDMAAMGARPVAHVLSITLPGWTEEEWLRGFYAGVERAAAEYGCPLVGGDTSSGDDVVISLAVIGEAPATGAVLRSTARPGQDLWLTGPTGESAAGLETLKRFGAEGLTSAQAAAVERHFTPTARVGLGMELAAKKLALAMIDVSDGILRDGGHIARLSGVGVVVESERLALSRTLSTAAAESGVDPLELALGGGEDYELLFTAEPARREEVEAACRAHGADPARIGRVVEGQGLKVVGADGGELNLSSGGFDHYG